MVSTVPIEMRRCIASYYVSYSFTSFNIIPSTVPDQGVYLFTNTLPSSKVSIMFSLAQIVLLSVTSRFHNINKILILLYCTTDR